MADHRLFASRWCSGMHHSDATRTSYYSHRSRGSSRDVGGCKWAALVVVSGTPAPVVEQLQNDIVAALGTAEVRSRAEQVGFEITPSTPGAVRERIQADIALYAPLVSEGRIARL